MLDRAVELGAELPAAPGASGVVVLAVAGSDPAGALRWEDGRPAEATVPGPGADLTLTLPAEDVDAVVAGRLAPSVAYMQGRLKTAGDNRLLLAVLAATATPAFHRWCAELRPS